MRQEDMTRHARSLPDGLIWVRAQCFSTSWYTLFVTASLQAEFQNGWAPKGE
jgi:hypothetical protein